MDSSTRGFAVMILMMSSTVSGSSAGIQARSVSIPARGVPTLRSEVRRHRDPETAAIEEDLEKDFDGDEKHEASVLQDPDDGDSQLEDEDSKHQPKVNDNDSTESGLSESDKDLDLTSRNKQTDGDANADSEDSGLTDGTSDFESAAKVEGVPKDVALEAQIKKLNEADIKDQREEENGKKPPKEESDSAIKKEEQRDNAEVEEEMKAEESGKPSVGKEESDPDAASFASNDASGSSQDALEKAANANFKDNLQDDKAMDAANKAASLDDESEADNSPSSQKHDESLSFAEGGAVSHADEMAKIRAADQAEAKAEAAADAQYALLMKREMADNAHPGADEEKSARVQKEVEEKRLSLLKDLEGRNNGLDDSVSASLVGGVEQSGVKDSIFDDK